jgi:CubicO group peptidase (beta-lactamase class C family)
VAGHAGVFSTAGDLFRFAEALRTGGPPLLRPATVAEMTRDHHVPPEAPTRATTEVPAEVAGGPAYAQGLGVRIGDPAIAAPLLGGPGPQPYGHSGFTGTSLLVDPARALTVILLTNNVHPRRDRPGIRALRHAVASLALKGHPRAAEPGGVTDSSG